MLTTFVTIAHNAQTKGSRSVTINQYDARCEEWRQPIKRDPPLEELRAVHTHMNTRRMKRRCCAPTLRTRCYPPRQQQYLLHLTLVIASHVTE